VKSAVVRGRETLPELRAHICMPADLLCSAEAASCCRSRSPASPGSHQNQGPSFRHGGLDLRRRSLVRRAWKPRGCVGRATTRPCQRTAWMLAHCRRTGSRSACFNVRRSDGDLPATMPEYAGRYCELARGGVGRGDERCFHPRRGHELPRATQGMHGWLPHLAVTTVFTESHPFEAHWGGPPDASRAPSQASIRERVAARPTCRLRAAPAGAVLARRRATSGGPRQSCCG
jgi:hypothetical protein